MLKSKPQIFTTAEISVASVVFGPLLGVYLFARNTELFGHRLQARKIRLVGYSVVVLYFIAIVILMPENLSNSNIQIFPFIPAGVIAAFVAKSERTIHAYKESGHMLKFGAWKMLILGFLSVILSVLVVLGSLYFKNPEIFNFQQAQTEYTDKDLKKFVNSQHEYSIKLPADFELMKSEQLNGLQVDIFKSKNDTTDYFDVRVIRLPKAKELVYKNTETTSTVLNNGLSSYDKALQVATGSEKTVTVTGDISVPGTKHKRGIFARVETINESGQILNIRAVIIPKNNGESLFIYISMLEESKVALDPLADIILRSISFQPN